MRVVLVLSIVEARKPFTAATAEEALPCEHDAEEDCQGNRNEQPAVFVPGRLYHQEDPFIDVGYWYFSPQASDVVQAQKMPEAGKTRKIYRC